MCNRPKRLFSAIPNVCVGDRAIRKDAKSVHEHTYAARSKEVAHDAAADFAVVEENAGWHATSRSAPERSRHAEPVQRANAHWSLDPDGSAQFCRKNSSELRTCAAAQARAFGDANVLHIGAGGDQDDVVEHRGGPRHGVLNARERIVDCARSGGRAVHVDMPSRLRACVGSQNDERQHCGGPNVRRRALHDLVPGFLPEAETPSEDLHKCSAQTDRTHLRQIPLRSPGYGHVSRCLARPFLLWPDSVFESGREARVEHTAGISAPPLAIDECARNRKRR
jgi:hypothetical protein